MPKYKHFLVNKEVMDVFCCVIDGNNTVKSIMKTLKQPQSTISEKLRFLVKEGVIIKDKWNFKPDWEIIKDRFQYAIREYFRMDLDFLKGTLDKKDKRSKEILIEAVDLINNLPNIFNERRVKRIVEEYSDSLHNTYLDKLSLNDLVELYLNILRRIDTTKFKRFGKDITRIKRFFNKLNIRDMEETLFTTVEGELK